HQGSENEPNAVVQCKGHLGSRWRRPLRVHQNLQEAARSRGHSSPQADHEREVVATKSTKGTKKLQLLCAFCAFCGFFFVVNSSQYIQEAFMNRRRFLKSAAASAAALVAVPVEKTQAQQTAAARPAAVVPNAAQLAADTATPRVEIDRIVEHPGSD